MRKIDTKAEHMLREQNEVELMSAIVQIAKTQSHEQWHPLYYADGS